MPNKCCLANELNVEKIIYSVASFILGIIFRGIAPPIIDQFQLQIAKFVTIKKLRQIRPYVIVGAFVVSAVVTPPDVFSQLILAVPLIILYEVGIIAARIIVGKDKIKEQETEAAEDAKRDGD